MNDVYEFEGDEVGAFSAQIPGTKLDVDEAWQRGTTLDMKISLRVRSVSIVEDRKGNVTRHHVLSLEQAVIDADSVETPAQRRAAFEAAEAALAAELAAEDKVISEEPGVEDQSDDEPGELRNDLTVESVERIADSGEQPIEQDADQYETAGF